MKFKAEITDGHTKIETACTVTEMLCCITMITNNLYSHLPDGEVKDFFKFAFKKAVNDDVPFIDNEAREKVAEKYEKEIEKANIEQEVKGFLEKMKGLLDDD